MKEGWEYKKLGEVAFYPTKRISSEMVNENNYVGVDNLIKDRGGKVVANFFPAEGNVIEYLKGDVLLGNIRPYLKKIWLSDTKGGASGDVLIIRANDTKHLYPNYLYWALASDQFFEYDTLHCKGAKMPRGNKIDIMKYQLPVPTIEEQQKVVSELDLLSGVIEKQKAQLEELDKLAQSIFYDMFGDPVANEKGWEMKKLGEECEDMKYGTSRPACENGRYKYLRMGNITLDGHLDLADLKTIDIPEEEVEKCIVRYGDILFNRTNSHELIGKTCMFDLDEPMIIAGYIIRVRLSENLKPIFISIMFNLPSMKKLLRSIAKGAVNQANINSKELASINIIIPPLSLQQEFAAKVEAIEAMKAKDRQSLKEVETLFNERMDYYFN